jgi:hypothetical protein
MRLSEMFVRCAVFSLMLAVPCSAALAQETSSSHSPCAALDTSLPQALSGWTSKAPLRSATNEPGLPAARLDLGHAAQATLHHTREVTYVVEPGKPGGSVAYGGILAVKIDEAGLYQVSLSSGAWIDLVLGASKIASTAHGHGPECSSIRKAVAFPLKPGDYIVQISANAAPTLDIMISRKP